MDSLILKINSKTYFFPLQWYDSKKENAREAHLKRRTLMFENGMKEKIVYKINLPRPNLGEWPLLKKKKSRDRMALTHDCSLLHSPSTSMNFYVSRGLLLFLPLCTYLFFKHSFFKFENKTFNSHLIIRYRCWHGPFLWRN